MHFDDKNLILNPFKMLIPLCLGYLPASEYICFCHHISFSFLMHSCIGFLKNKNNKRFEPTTVPVPDVQSGRAPQSIQSFKNLYFWIFRNLNFEFFEVLLPNLSKFISQIIRSLLFGFFEVFQNFLKYIFWCANFFLNRAISNHSQTTLSSFLKKKPTNKEIKTTKN